MDRSALTRLRNVTRSPRVDTLAKLASALGCTIDDLVTVEELPDLPKRTRMYDRPMLRLMALKHYGLECACCGESEFGFLTIDHIVPSVPDVGHRTHLYHWLRKNEYPAGFQTLCMSCNVAKSDTPECPHGWSPASLESCARHPSQWLKTKTLAAYGGVCACCGESGQPFLAIDHVNGDGKQHRLSISHGKSGTAFYKALERRGYPNDPPLRVLCHNCNHAVRFGVCPHQA